MGIFTDLKANCSTTRKYIYIYCEFSVVNHSACRELGHRTFLSEAFSGTSPLGGEGQGPLERPLSHSVRTRSVAWRGRQFRSGSGGGKGRLGGAVGTS